MQITIRKAKTDDAKVIAELHKKVVREVNAKFYSSEAIREWLGNISEENVRYQFQNSDWIVAKESGRLVGFGQYSVVDGEIYQINVDPDFLKQGIGRRLYDMMEDKFKNVGKEKISLNATLNAVGFYERLGFTRKGKTHIGLVKMIKMEKSLRDSQ